jgi:hypothetical protein
MANYCPYCKEKIEKGDRVIKGKNGRIFHSECYIQMNTYIDEFGDNFTTDEFGSSSVEEYGY